MKNIICICLGMSLILLLCLFLPKSNVDSENSLTESSAISSQYIVKEYEGQVAIFSDDSDLPIKVYDTSVTALPKCDREKLQLGITVETPEELQKIIEDFTG